MTDIDCGSYGTLTGGVCECVLGWVGTLCDENEIFMTVLSHVLGTCWEHTIAAGAWDWGWLIMLDDLSFFYQLQYSSLQETLCLKPSSRLLPAV
ncbi:hypothetical protein KIPB_002480 [Kipferlia bialata]|uniref:EGF-like domain-containing protein n=1 Tax=Kipferlia bialata TaxID=797122 RepID=A0A9K3CQN4_9EUKA|nr:hypothetical protein KIPB_002480 [Kipferlia bialata]|eukprot:g2480.t1